MRIVAVAVGALGLLGAGFGTAEAVSAFAPGTIHGCITGTNRVLEHVYVNPNKGLTCPSGSSSVSWQQVNTAGPKGLDVVEVQQQATVGPHNGVSANCPADHPYVLTGGYSTSPADDVTIMQSLPIGTGSSGPLSLPESWGVWIGNFTGTNPPPVTNLEVFALCAK